MLRHINILFIVTVILQINYLGALEEEIEFADIIKGLKGQILEDNTESNGYQSSNADDDVSLAEHKHDSNKRNYVKKNTKQEIPYGLLNAIQSPLSKLQAEKNQDLSSNTDNDDTVAANKNKDEQLFNLVQTALAEFEGDRKNNKHENKKSRNDDRLQTRNKNNDINKNNKQKSQLSSSKLPKFLPILKGLEDYSKIYVILNPRAGLKKKEQKTVAHLLSEIIQSFTSAKKEDGLGLRRRNRDSDEDDGDRPKKGSYKREEPGVGGRTRLPFQRYRGNIYED